MSITPWFQYSLILTALCFMPGQAAYAAEDSAWQLNPNLVAGGSLRLRYESKQNFAFGAATAANAQDYWLHQLRLNLAWQPSDKVRVFIEGQDARIHQATQTHSIDRSATPNIYEDHWDVHQAYVDVDIMAGDATLRIGRQKLNIAAQRLIASLEWVNTARVLDGIRWTNHWHDKHVLDIFATQLVPVSPESANGHAATGSRMFNSRFHGLYYTHKALGDGLQSEFYLLQRLEDSVSDDVLTQGMRFAYQTSVYDADAEWMQQSGYFSGLTHDALAYHLGVGIEMHHIATHIGVAYNFASGDADANDNKHQTFDNLYPLNHAYYGFMDFFSLQNIHNWEVVGKTKLAQGLVLRSAWQGFWLDKEDSDAWYNAGGKAVRTATTDVSSYVGQEIDLTLIYTIADWQAKAIVGYSHFFAGDYIQATGNNSTAADFLFMQIKFKL